jgi:trk system potassium uptake protein TrkH
MSREPPPRRYPRTLRRPTRTEVVLEQRPPRRRRVPLSSLPLLLIAGFAFAIAIGTVLLMLPFASRDGDWTSPVIALFIATSAVCVTGLVPVDTGTYWSGFGHAVIVVLIQAGGLGIMTSTTLLFLLFGWRVGLRERVFLSQSMDITRVGGIVALTRRAILFTAIIEFLGFVLLAARFAFDEPIDRALWWGLFHSISAFNNAGFDLFGGFSSLENHSDFFTLTAIAVLVVLGGIGFLVVEDVLRHWKTGISVDSVVVLRTTAALLVVGFFVFLTLEWDFTLADRNVPTKVIDAAFHSVAPRTAGFSALPVSEMNDETQFFTIGLMFIGGGSASTAGGIKVGTFAIVLAAAMAAIRGREHVETAGREIRRVDVDRALAVFLLAGLFVFVVASVLARLEDAPFLNILFEATSAFGTTGLSTGITPDLSDASLLLLVVTMFVGRLGPMTLVLALVQRASRDYRRLPEERIRIG